MSPPRREERRGRRRTRKVPRNEPPTERPEARSHPTRALKETAESAHQVKGAMHRMVCYKRSCTLEEAAQPPNGRRYRLRLLPVPSTRKAAQALSLRVRRTALQKEAQAAGSGRKALRDSLPFAAPPPAASSCRPVSPRGAALCRPPGREGRDRGRSRQPSTSVWLCLVGKAQAAENDVIGISSAQGSRER